MEKYHILLSCNEKLVAKFKMEKFFIVLNGLQQGPFTIEQLVGKGINSSTLVWTEKLDNWVEAKNIEDLKEIIRNSPPPIPDFVHKSLRNEANKRVNAILLAKEIKINFKLVLSALVIGIISYPIHYSMNDGFAHQSISNKLHDSYALSNQMYDQLSKEEQQKTLSDYNELERESEALGYDRNNMEHLNLTPLGYHEKQYHIIASDSFMPSIKTFLISILLLISVRYLYKGVKWVKINSKTRL